MSRLAGVLAVALAVQAPMVRAGPITWPQAVSAAAPGCAVGASRNGLVVTRDHRGMANLEHDVAIGPDTVFEAGSASKQFLAAAVLMLAQEGRLSLDDDIRKHLPEMAALRGPITVDQLLRHTSGLRDWRMIRGLAGWQLGSAVHTNEDALKAAGQQRGLNHAPGDAFSYTNTGYSLLAVIVERTAGESLAEFSRRRIFEPLGMERTRWRDDFRAVVPGRAVAYSRDAGSGAWRQDMPFEHAYGAGGLLTTIGDLLTWNRALDEGRLGSGVTEGLQAEGRLNDGSPTGYGRGLYLRRYRGVEEYGHGGITAGYVAYVARYPEQSVSVAVLCNNGQVNPRLLAESVADGLIAPDERVSDQTRTEPPPADPRPLWRPALEETAPLIGLYRSDEIGADYRIERRDGALWLVLQGVPGLERRLSPLYADELVFMGGVIRIQRQGDAVVGFTLDVDRAKGLEFRRSPEDASG